jgi:hypothetical protein
MGAGRGTPSVASIHEWEDEVGMKVKTANKFEMSFARRRGRDILGGSLLSWGLISLMHACVGTGGHTALLGGLGFALMTILWEVHLEDGRRCLSRCRSPRWFDGWVLGSMAPIWVVHAVGVVAAIYFGWYL